MAPEMYDSGYGPSVDIYAFGFCVLEMITRVVRSAASNAIHPMHSVCWCLLLCLFLLVLGRCGCVLSVAVAVAVLWLPVLCCAVLCCAVLPAVLCCAVPVLCCAWV